MMLRKKTRRGYGPMRYPEMISVRVPLEVKTKFQKLAREDEKFVEVLRRAIADFLENEWIIREGF